MHTNDHDDWMALSHELTVKLLAATLIVLLVLKVRTGDFSSVF
jgi:hypothetical protein